MYIIVYYDVYNVFIECMYDLCVYIEFFHQFSTAFCFFTSWLSLDFIDFKTQSLPHDSFEGCTGAVCRCWAKRSQQIRKQEGTGFSTLSSS